MSREKSSISGGGTRVTEHVNSSDLFGNDRSYTQTTDYSSTGENLGGVKTNHEGDQYRTDSTGRTTEHLGNDGRK